MLSFHLLLILLYRAYGALLYANRGDNVVLQCFLTSNAKYLSWYKQVAGGQPQLISSFYKHLPDAIHFHNQFNDGNRFSALTGEGVYHLIISDVKDSDSALYYCGQTSITITEFQEGIHLILKGSGSFSYIVQSASDPVKPGDSVTLSCAVQTKACDGEHSVYWFKNSEGLYPGLIFTQGGTSNQCEREPLSQTHTCVHNLPLESLNRSHAGDYYCAVASCGHILFGNGTKLEIKSDDMTFIGGVVTSSTILAVLLAVVCIIKNINTCRSTESRATFSAPSATHAEIYQNPHTLYYPVCISLSDKLGQQKDQTWSECVYFRVNWEKQ